MLFTTVLAFTALAVSARAHVSLQYPSPRGPFNAPDEVKPCDGYTEIKNRTTFPLSDGIISLKTGHSEWNIGILISTKDSPHELADFNTSASGGDYQWAVAPSKQTGEGVFCLPVDVSKLGLSDVKNGSNATLQLVFNGGDGNLFQCMDLTFSDSAKEPSVDELQCKQAVNVPSPSAIGSSPSATATSPSGSSASPTPGSNGAASHAPALSGVLGLIALALAV